MAVAGCGRCRAGQALCAVGKQTRRCLGLVAVPGCDPTAVTFAAALQDAPYDPSQDSVLQRVRFMFGES